MDQNTEATETKNLEIQPITLNNEVRQNCKKINCPYISDMDAFNELVNELARKGRNPDDLSALLEIRREVLETCRNCKVFHRAQEPAENNEREEKINRLIMRREEEWQSRNRNSFRHRRKGYEVRIDTETDGGIIYLHAQLEGFKARFSVDPDNFTVYVQPHAGEKIPPEIQGLRKKDKDLIGRFILGEILIRIRDARDTVSSRKATDAQPFYTL